MRCSPTWRNRASRHYQWLAPGEMLDGLGLAETTPGPLILVTQFVGFLAAFRAAAPEYALLAGSVGALLTPWVTFLPCFLWIFLGAPHVERLRRQPALAAALAAITAAVVGVIANLAVWFAAEFPVRQRYRDSWHGPQCGLAGQPQCRGPVAVGARCPSSCSGCILESRARSRSPPRQRLPGRSCSGDVRLGAAPRD